MLAGKEEQQREEGVCAGLHVQTRAGVDRRCKLAQALTPKSAWTEINQSPVNAQACTNFSERSSQELSMSPCLPSTGPFVTGHLWVSSCELISLTLQMGSLNNRGKWVYPDHSTSLARGQPSAGSHHLSLHFSHTTPPPVLVFFSFSEI